MFKRLSNLIRGFFGLFIGGMERRAPEALLEVERENLRTQIGRYNQGLASHAALAERLMGQVRRQEKEEGQLRAKITAHLKVSNKSAAAQYALRHQELTRELEENRRQLVEAEKTYKDLVRARDVSIQTAKAKIESLKRQISDMQIQKATAELHEMAAGMISEIGGAGDTLNRLEEMVQEERDMAAGRARVARDAVTMGDIDLVEAERDALADQALADFAAAQGLSLGDEGEAAPTPQASSEDEEPGKSIGPIAGSQ